MDILLLGIYAFLVWLIFIKLKWLPWTTPWKVGVFIFPVVALATLLLLLNVMAPATTDVRVISYVVGVVSQVRGRVTEVPIDNNRPVKKGDVLFKIDPTPYQNDVHSLEARLEADQAKVGADLTRLTEARAKLTDAQSSEPQLKEQLNQATAQVASLNASITLARTRVEQNTKLVAATDKETEDLRGARSAGNSPIKKERPQSWTVEPWNGQRRKSVRKRTALTGPVPPLPGQESNAAAALNPLAEEDLAAEMATAESGERGRLFVKVMGVKDLDLPLPKGSYHT